MIQLNNDVATKALMSIENGNLSRKRPNAGGYTRSGSGADTQRPAPLKRTRSRFALSGSFDMGEFLKASQQVEDTIAFPAIVWPSFDNDDDSSSCDTDSATSSLIIPREHEEIDNEDEEEEYNQCRRKRHCRGLTRSGRSCNLSSLVPSTENRSERRGSNGSLS